MESGPLITRSQSRSWYEVLRAETDHKLVAVDARLRQLERHIQAPRSTNRLPKTDNPDIADVDVVDETGDAAATLELFVVSSISSSSLISPVLLLGGRGRKHPEDTTLIPSRLMNRNPSRMISVAMMIGWNCPSWIPTRLASPIANCSSLANPSSGTVEQSR